MHKTFIKRHVIKITALTLTSNQKYKNNILYNVIHIMKSEIYGENQIYWGNYLFVCLFVCFFNTSSQNRPVRLAPCFVEMHHMVQQYYLLLITGISDIFACITKNKNVINYMYFSFISYTHPCVNISSNPNIRSLRGLTNAPKASRVVIRSYSVFKMTYDVVLVVWA